MNKYIQYRVKLLEPMKLSGQGSQQGTEVSRSFIQGQAIRGALIGAFCRNNPECILDEEAELREKFLTGTKFYNAYIVQEERKTLPVPMIYLVSKEESRKEKDIQVRSSLYAEGKHLEGEAYARNEFGNLESDVLLRAEIRKTEQLHIQKAERKGKENKMFRYQAVERGQEFIGYIQCKEEWAEDFKTLLEQKIFYIGGSKGSGYGKCEITYQTDYSYADFVKQLPVKRSDDSKKLVIYALSDLILLNEYGMVTNQIDSSCLERILGIKQVTLQKSYCDTSITFGYNQKTRTHAVQQTAVQAGSIFVYQYEGEIAEENRMLLEEQGVGLRREEGYGQIYVNPELNQNISNQIEKSHSQQAMSYKTILEDAETKEKNFVEKIADKIREKKEHETIQYKLIPNKYEEIGARNWRVTRTQANGLYNMLSTIYDGHKLEDCEGDKKVIKEYMEHLRNQSSLETTMLYQDHMCPVSMKDFLERLGDGTAKLCSIETEWREKGQSEAEHFYESCLYLKELLSYFLKKEAQ